MATTIGASAFHGMFMFFSDQNPTASSRQAVISVPTAALP